MINSNKDVNNGSSKECCRTKAFLTLVLEIQLPAHSSAFPALPQPHQLSKGHGKQIFLHFLKENVMFDVL